MEKAPPLTKLFSSLIVFSITLLKFIHHLNIFQLQNLPNLNISAFGNYFSLFLYIKDSLL